jgi:hypothetical protein
VADSSAKSDNEEVMDKLHHEHDQDEVGIKQDKDSDPPSDNPGSAHDSQDTSDRENHGCECHHLHCHTKPESKDEEDKSNS